MTSTSSSLYSTVLPGPGHGAILAPLYQGPARLAEIGVFVPWQCFQAGRGPWNERSAHRWWSLLLPPAEGWLVPGGRLRHRRDPPREACGVDFHGRTCRDPCSADVRGYLDIQTAVALSATGSWSG